MSELLPCPRCSATGLDVHERLCLLCLGNKSITDRRKSAAPPGDWNAWCERFWQIVDKDGVLGLPSDEWNALSRLVDAYNRRPDAGQEAVEKMQAALEIGKHLANATINGQPKSYRTTIAWDFHGALDAYNAALARRPES